MYFDFFQLNRVKYTLIVTLFLLKKVMSSIYLAEKKVKVQMINEILKVSDKFQSKRELESKLFSELKYIYYDSRKPEFDYSNN
jgi:hypothetical protein